MLRRLACGNEEGEDADDRGTELAVDEPQFDAGVALPAAQRDGGGEGGPRKRERAEGETRRTRGPIGLCGNYRHKCLIMLMRKMNRWGAP
jgi:hypothetical protein